MNRYILILLFFININQLALCQLSLNVLTGMNLAWKDVDLNDPLNMGFPEEYNYQYQPITKQAFGLQLKHPANNYLDVNFELQYSIKGNQIEGGIHKEHLHYMKYIQSLDVSIWKDLKIGAGYFWGYLIVSRTPRNLPTKSYFREEWDNGPIIAMTYIFNKFSIRASYYHSFSKVGSVIVSELFESTVRSISFKNRAFQIMLGYNLIGKKKTLLPTDTKL